MSDVFNKSATNDHASRHASPIILSYDTVEGPFEIHLNLRLYEDRGRLIKTAIWAAVHNIELTITPTH